MVFSGMICFPISARLHFFDDKKTRNSCEALKVFCTRVSDIGLLLQAQG